MKDVTRRVKRLNKRIKVLKWARTALVVASLALEVGLLLYITGNSHPIITSVVLLSVFIGAYIVHFLQVQKINELLDPGFTEVYFEKDEALNWVKPAVTDHAHSRTRLHEIAWWLNNGYRRTISIETNNAQDLDPKAFNVVESDGDFIGLVIGRDVVESELVDSNEFTPLLIQRIAYKRPETFLKRARANSFFTVSEISIVVLAFAFVLGAFASLWSLLFLPVFLGVAAYSLFLSLKIWRVETERGDLAAAFMTSPVRLLEALDIYAQIVDLEADFELSVPERVDEYLSRMFQVRREGLFTTRKSWEKRLRKIESWKSKLSYLDRWPLAGERVYYEGQDPKKRSMARYEDEVGPQELWDVFKLRDSKILFDRHENVTPLPRNWRRLAARK